MANLLPEVPDDAIRAALAPHDNVAPAYSFTSNGGWPQGATVI